MFETIPCLHTNRGLDMSEVEVVDATMAARTRAESPLYPPDASCERPRNHWGLNVHVIRRRVTRLMLRIGSASPSSV